MRGRLEQLITRATMHCRHFWLNAALLRAEPRACAGQAWGYGLTRTSHSASWPILRCRRAGGLPRCSPHRLANQRVRILDSIEVLPSDPRSRELVIHLVGDGLLPRKASADAEHIAIAAIHSVHYLLTWNCRHLANPCIARNVVRTCERFGFSCPEICTPEQLMRACANDRSNHQGNSAASREALQGAQSRSTQSHGGLRSRGA